MANPNGNLAGWSDPEEEGWQQRALERVRARQRSTRRDARNNGMYMFFDDGFRQMLDEACYRRNISLTGYGRRATGAFIAHDLGLPIEDVLYHTARPAGYTEHSGRRPAQRSHDDGRGMGLWIIDGLALPPDD
jgi:hypothetical protein